MKKNILYICICLFLSPQLNAQESLFRIFINDVNTSGNEDNEGEENDENFTDWVSFFANKCAYNSSDIEDLNSKLNQGGNVVCNNVSYNPSDDAMLAAGLNISLSMNLSDNSNSVFDYFQFIDSINLTNSKSLNGFNRIQSSNSINVSNNQSEDVNMFSGLNYAGQFNITNNQINTLNLSSPNLGRIDNLVFSGNVSNTINLFNGLSSTDSVIITNNKAEELTFADNGNLGYLGNLNFQNNDIKSFTGIPNAYVENAIISNNPNLESLNVFSNTSSMGELELKNNPKLNNITTNSNNYPFNNDGNVIFDNLGFTNLNLETMYPNIKNLPNLQIINNEKLTTIDGMMNGYSSSNKINFFGDITIENNPLLKNISGFYGQLQSSDINIRNNDVLENITGLKLQNATGSILIENNPSLITLNSPLTEVNSSLSLIIRNNDNLKNFQNWSNFMYVSNFSFYLDSPVLEEFNVGGAEECVIDSNHPINILPNVSLSRGFNIKASPNLHTVNLFTNCRVMQGTITVKDTNISNLIFGNKHKFYKEITIENNPNISSLTLLTADNTGAYYYPSSSDPNRVLTPYIRIKQVDKFVLKNNNNITNLSGFKNSQAKYFEITNNNSLTSLNIFDNIIEYNQSAVSLDIIIENNPNLSTISDITMDSVTNMSLKNNNLSNTTMLTNVYEMENLDLTGNNNLNDLSGLNQIRIYSSLKINQKNYGQKINNAEICGCLYNNGNIFKEDGSFYSNINEYCIIPENLDNTSCAVRDLPVEL